MYKRALGYFEKLNDGKKLIAFCQITNSAGVRIFGTISPPENVNVPESPQIYDATYTYNGAITYGSNSNTVIDYGGRVLSWGELRETLLPDEDDLILSQQAQEISTVSLVLNNADKYFSKLLGRENLISATVEIIVGFLEIGKSDFLSIFEGAVNDFELNSTDIVLDVWSL